MLTEEHYCPLTGDAPGRKPAARRAKKKRAPKPRGPRCENCDFADWSYISVGPRTVMQCNVCGRTTPVPEPAKAGA